MNKNIEEIILLLTNNPDNNYDELYAIYDDYYNKKYKSFYIKKTLGEKILNMMFADLTDNDILYTFVTIDPNLEKFFEVYLDMVNTYANDGFVKTAYGNINMNSWKKWSKKWVEELDAINAFSSTIGPYLGYRGKTFNGANQLFGYDAFINIKKDIDIYNIISMVRKSYQCEYRSDILKLLISILDSIFDNSKKLYFENNEYHKLTKEVYSLMDKVKCQYDNIGWSSGSDGTYILIYDTSDTNKKTHRRMTYNELKKFKEVLDMINKSIKDICDKHTFKY